MHVNMFWKIYHYQLWTLSFQLNDLSPFLPHNMLNKAMWFSWFSLASEKKVHKTINQNIPLLKWRGPLVPVLLDLLCQICKKKTACKWIQKSIYGVNKGVSIRFGLVGWVVKWWLKNQMSSEKVNKRNRANTKSIQVTVKWKWRHAKRYLVEQ